MPREEQSSLRLSTLRAARELPRPAAKVCCVHRTSRIECRGPTCLLCCGGPAGAAFLELCSGLTALHLHSKDPINGHHFRAALGAGAAVQGGGPRELLTPGTRENPSYPHSVSGWGARGVLRGLQCRHCATRHTVRSAFHFCLHAKHGSKGLGGLPTQTLQHRYFGAEANLARSPRLSHGTRNNNVHLQTTLLTPSQGAADALANNLCLGSDVVV